MSSQLLINLSFLATKPTGHTIYAKNLVSQLQSLEPTLLSSQQFSGFKHYSIPGNMTPDQGSKGHFSRLVWTQFQLPKLYQKLQGNLLFSPIPEAPLFSNCRSIVTLHDLIPLKFPRWSSPLTPYFKYYIPQVLGQAKQIICDSEATANDAAHYYKIPVQKMTIVPLAYDSSHFQCLNLPIQNYFLYIGRHDAYKNLQRVIQAFSTLQTDAQMWIAGPSDRRHTPVLMAQIEALGLTDRVKFLSYVPYAELPTVINQAIALVFPSLCEGFGLPILEAMACGTPVITSNLSSMPEVAGDAALLVNPYDVGAIGEAMEAIASDSSLRSCLRQLSLTRASEFSWTKTAESTANVLKQYL
ncbi:glycosyltransferase family 4 protein [Phormidesmis sp. 146-35]